MACKKVFKIFIRIALTIQLAASSSFDSNRSCPIWTISRNGTCECGNDVNNVVHCDETSLSLVQFYCMTYSDAFNTTVVGHCLYNIHYRYNIYSYYRPIPKLVHRNDSAMCYFQHSLEEKYQHQTGLMCTSCVDGYAYPVYSYSITCVECTDYKYNCLKYIAVAFLPLTLFYIIVVLFRISVTSGAMNGYVLVCQLVTTQYMIRAVLSTKNVGKYTLPLAIWNLDFFRALYPPFCLHPKLTTLQTLMFDYVVAVYPLLLVILTYICVKLHNRYSIVVRLWSPFYKSFALLRNNWDIKGSLVGAFATFILLSYVKILNVSFIILTPNTFYDVKGNQMSKRFLYFDGSYEYFGADHIPYALLAIFMLLVFNIFPLLLLCLYPCCCFQRCLNYCRLQSLALHIFMDTFNGCYKIKPRDCRYFAAFYLFLRFVNHTLIFATLEQSYFSFIGMVLAITVALIATVNPYKTSWHTLLDTALLTILVLTCFSVSVKTMYNDNYHKVFKRITAIMLLSLPFTYGIGALVYVLLPNKVIFKLKHLFQQCKLVFKTQTETEENMYSDEYRSLLSQAISNYNVTDTWQNDQ